MDEKPKGKRTPGPLGRRSGIGLDQTMPEYEGPSEPRAPVRRPARPVPEADALPDLSGAPPEKPSAPPRPAPAPPPARAPESTAAPWRTAPSEHPLPAPPPPVSPPPQSPPPADLQHSDPHDAGPTAPEAAEAADEVEANNLTPEPPKRSHTSRLSTSDLDMTSNPRREDNLGIKFKSDRSRWW